MARMATGRWERLTRLGVMAARMKMDRPATAPENGTDNPARFFVDDEYLARQVARLLKTLGTMKGAAMKFAQMLHAHAHLLPPAARAVIDEFDDHVPPMTHKQLLQVFKRELKDEPQNLFATFEFTPLGAASIGQVHAATLKNGLDVVVKVQYPGIDRTIRSDLANLKLLIATGAFMVDSRVRFDHLLLELNDRLREELDYRNEVANLTRFKELYGHLEEVVFPTPVPELSTQRLLTSERLVGLSIDEAEQASPELRQLWGRALMRFFAATVLQKGVLHADPHPGNFMFLPDGRLGVLDFGSVKTLPPAFFQAHNNIVMYALKDDFENTWRWMKKGRYLTQASTEEHARVLYAAVRYTVAPLHTPGFCFGRDLVFTRIGELDWGVRERSEKAGVPKDALFLNRTSFGIYGLLCRLKVEDDWGAVVADLMPAGPVEN